MTNEINPGQPIPESASDGSIQKERSYWISLLLSQFCDVFFTLDSDWRFMEVWGRFEELFHRPPESVIGQSVLEVFPSLAQSMFQQKTLEAVQASRATWVRGQILPWAGWLEVLVHPTPNLVEFYVRDIGAFKQEQTEIAGAVKSQVLFDALLENIPEGIIIADARDASILVVSDYGVESFGLRKDAILHRPFHQVLEEVSFYFLDTLAPVRPEEHPLMRALVGGDLHADETYFMRNARGEEFTVSCKYGPIRNENGEIIAGIFSWMDTTERRRAEAALEEATRRLAISNRALETFATSASHDLQEPLRKIVGFSEILNRKYSGEMDGEMRDLLERMTSASQRMQGMIDNVLSFSRVSASSPKLSVVDLNQVLNVALSDLEVRIQKSGAVVAVDPLPTLLADSTQMEQLFLNLLTNGLKFHKPGIAPHIRVFADNGERSGWTRIAVQDNGIGFDMAQAERMFQPFQRLNARSAYEGSGLGLAICQKIVEHHGGKITATSTPGEGAIFWIELPLGGVIPSTGEFRRL